MTQFEITVEGKVQGVGFRYFVHQKANEMGITGWVKNTIDGDVLVLAQGIETELKTFIDYLYVGPTRSRVERITINKIQVSTVFNNFSVKY
jgi:acylphosphatase